ncbi:MAG: T9SS type A sorting domain-containing protein [Chitinophagaceae bacterium]
MKKLFFLLLTIASFKAKATNYYLSNTGNDVNNGTSTTTPIKTINKLNTLTLIAGDTIFFKCGDTFRGQVNIIAAGNSASPIVFTSYGTGAKPIISGAEIITGFTLNGSKYEKILTQKMNNFFVSDKEQTLARYPNNGRYLWLDSAQKSYLKDADLASIPTNFINNSRICVHTAQWCWEKSSVSSYNNAEKLTYNTNMSLAALANYAYFLYDNINLLDTANEWKFDSTTMLLTYLPSSGVNPNNVTCEASVYTNGFNISGFASYITIINLQFEKQMNAGIATASTSNKFILIKDCSINRQYNYGIYDRGKYNEVNNCSFRENDGFGVFVSGTGAGNCNVHHSTFRNIGQFRNSGIGTEINLTAIKFAFVDSCTAHHNDIDSAGYCGISADGGYHLIEKNIIKNAMLLNNDGAALKSYGAQSHHITFRNNFVSKSDGNTEGTTNANFITPAIYFDFNVNNCLVENNTLFDRTQKGIFQNAGDINNTIVGNTIYGANYGIDFNGHPNQGTADTLNGYTVKKNSIFLKNATDFFYRYVDFSNTYRIGIIDSNYYCQPYSATRFFNRPGATPQVDSFKNWKNLGYDANGIINNFIWNNGIDSSQLFINPTDNSVQQNLNGWVWKDLAGNTITNLVLEPWTSKILIRTSTILPLTFLKFKATLNKEIVSCTWETSNETNVNYFNIQRSSDGKTFETIYVTKATGKKSYTEHDNLTNTTLNKYYYRIESIDYDGKKQYSTTEEVKINNTNFTYLNVYPNPTSSILQVNFSESIKELKIINQMGQVLMLVYPNTSKTSINTTNLTKGVYYIIVKNKNENLTTEKFVKF